LQVPEAALLPGVAGVVIITIVATTLRLDHAA
jgi:hypothetical protein